MSPITFLTNSLQRRAISPDASVSSQELREQWKHPSEVFSVLLLLGGEIVNKALAQLVGDVVTPVTFSFGWVSFAVTTLLASVGDTRLMPAAPEGSCIVITAKNGYVRNNGSWIIGRIVRDYDHWMDAAVRTRLQHLIDERHKYMLKRTEAGTSMPKPKQAGLCIGVYNPSTTEVAAHPTRDLIWWSGLCVAFLQLLISAVPVLTTRDWTILLTTSAGITLALVTGGLPQWRLEKWACRRGSNNGYIITRGNGSQHAILILGNGKGLNLEDLAVSGQVEPPRLTLTTRACLVVISLLWVILLIVAAGAQSNTWYLLAVGAIGILQNLLAAGWRRDPGTLGIHLVFKEVVGELTVMDSLLALEAKYPKSGKSLLPIFFPGELRPNEADEWEVLRLKQEADAKILQQKSGVQAIVELPESWTAHALTYQTK